MIEGAQGRFTPSLQSQWEDCDFLLTKPSGLGTVEPAVRTGPCGLESIPISLPIGSHTEQKPTGLSFCGFNTKYHLLTLFQESYVWKMYQERCWDFFPAGDCFRKQYEDQLG